MIPPYNDHRSFLVSHLLYSDRWSLVKSNFLYKKLTIGMTICLALLGSVQAIIVSLMIITLSGNKLEGMAVTKLSALTLLGIPVPFFIDSYYQFAVGFLPSYWVAKAVQNEAVLYFPIALVVALIWYYFLIKRLFRKLAG